MFAGTFQGRIQTLSLAMHATLACDLDVAGALLVFQRRVGRRTLVLATADCVRVG
jgi:hypothetical protein